MKFASAGTTLGGSPSGGAYLDLNESEQARVYDAGTEVVKALFIAGAVALGIMILASAVSSGGGYSSANSEPQPSKPQFKAVDHHKTLVNDTNAFLYHSEWRRDLALDRDAPLGRMDFIELVNDGEFFGICLDDFVKAEVGGDTLDIPVNKIRKITPYLGIDSSTCNNRVNIDLVDGSVIRRATAEPLRFATLAGVRRVRFAGPDNCCKRIIGLNPKEMMDLTERLKAAIESRRSEVSNTIGKDKFEEIYGVAIPGYASYQEDDAPELREDIPNVNYLRNNGSTGRLLIMGSDCHHSHKTDHGVVFSKSWFDFGNDHCLIDNLDFDAGIEIGNEPKVRGTSIVLEDSGIPVGSQIFRKRPKDKFLWFLSSDGKTRLKLEPGKLVQFGPYTLSYVPPDKMESA